MISFSFFIFLIHFVATCMMTGAIWFAQISVYPLLQHVGRDTFLRYQYEHVRRVSPVAWTLMSVELVSGVLLLFVFFQTPFFVYFVSNMVLLALIWWSTWVWQLTYHKKLLQGFEVHAHKKLVATNWIRTASWTVRVVLIVVILIELVA